MRPSPCGNMAGSKHSKLMRAEEYWKLLLHLLTADGGKGPLYAVAGIVKDPHTNLIIGQGRHFIGGTIHAFRGSRDRSNTPVKSHTDAPGDIIRFAAARGVESHGVCV